MSTRTMNSTSASNTLEHIALSGLLPTGSTALAEVLGEPAPRADLHAPVAHVAGLLEGGREALHQVFVEGVPQTTRRAYSAALSYWQAWHVLRYGGALQAPTPPGVVVQFLLDHIDRNGDSNAKNPRYELPWPIESELVRQGLKRDKGALSLSHVGKALAALAKFNLGASGDRSNPASDPVVRATLGRLKALAAASGRVRQPAPALTAPLLEQLLAACDDGTLAGVRDAALIAFGWASGGRRRSEIAGARLEFLRVVASADERPAYLYRLTSTKTCKDPNIVNEKPVFGRAGHALKLWLDRVGLQTGSTGPIFRWVRGETVCDHGLSGASVNAIIKRRAEAAGLTTGDDPVGAGLVDTNGKLRVSAHSLRAGYITEGLDRGFSIEDVMMMTDHADRQTAAAYRRPTAKRDAPIATMMDLPRADRADQRRVYEACRPR